MKGRLKKVDMEQGLRNVFLIFLLLAMLLLLGSGRKADLPATPSEAERAAMHLGEIVPKGEMKEWQRAASQNPLWLLRVTGGETAK